jgi:hypothetical protein
MIVDASAYAPDFSVFQEKFRLFIASGSMKDTHRFQSQTPE